MSVTLKSALPKPLAALPPDQRSVAGKAWAQYAKDLLKHNKADAQAHCTASRPSWRKTVQMMLHGFLVLDGWRNPIAMAALETNGVVMHNMEDPLQAVKATYCRHVEQVARRTAPQDAGSAQSRFNMTRELRAIEEMTIQYCKKSRRMSDYALATLGTLAAFTRFPRMIQYRHADLYERVGTAAALVSESGHLLQMVEADQDHRVFCNHFQYDVMLIQEFAQRPASDPAYVHLTPARAGEEKKG